MNEYMPEANSRFHMLKLNSKRNELEYFVTILTTA